MDVGHSTGDRGLDQVGKIARGGGGGGGGASVICCAHLRCLLSLLLLCALLSFCMAHHINLISTSGFTFTIPPEIGALAELDQLTMMLAVHWWWLCGGA